MKSVVNISLRPDEILKTQIVLRGEAAIITLI